jgi:hypothetical protein
MLKMEGGIFYFRDCLEDHGIRPVLQEGRTEQVSPPRSTSKKQRTDTFFRGHRENGVGSSSESTVKKVQAHPSGPEEE